MKSVCKVMLGFLTVSSVNPSIRTCESMSQHEFFVRYSFWGKKLLEKVEILYCAKVLCSKVSQYGKLQDFS